MKENKQQLPYLYIDQDVNVHIGDEARSALEQCSDRGHLRSGAGIPQVPLTRWQEAQRAERTHWMKLGLRNWNDRNDEHYRKFDGYRSIQGRNFGNALEIGCGPFTNLGIIAAQSKIETASLLDPLIKDYLLHPYAMYTRSYLTIRRSKTPFLKLHRLLAKIAPNIHARVFNRMVRIGVVPIQQLLAIPVEQLPTTIPKFDVIVAINVIEHCYDIHKVLERMRHLNPGGILIFQDKIYHHDVVTELVTSLYDAAHPLKVDQKIIDAFLHLNFRPIFHQQYQNIDRVSEFLHSYEELYFIGEKL